MAQSAAPASGQSPPAARLRASAFRLALASAAPVIRRPPRQRTAPHARCRAGRRARRSRNCPARSMRRSQAGTRSSVRARRGGSIRRTGGIRSRVDAAAREPHATAAAAFAAENEAGHRLHSLLRHAYARALRPATGPSAAQRAGSACRLAIHAASVEHRGDDHNPWCALSYPPPPLTGSGGPQRTTCGPSLYGLVTSECAR